MEAGEHQRTRLETEALIIGYAMSRLDADYLRLRRLSRWQETFAEAAAAQGLDFGVKGCPEWSKAKRRRENY